MNTNTFCNSSAFQFENLSNYSNLLNKTAYRTFCVVFPRFAIVCCLLFYLTIFYFQFSFRFIRMQPSFVHCNNFMQASFVTLFITFQQFFEKFAIAFVLSFKMLGIHLAEAFQTPKNSFKIFFKKTRYPMKYLLFLQSGIQLLFRLCQ